MVGSRIHLPLSHPQHGFLFQPGPRCTRNSGCHEQTWKSRKENRMYLFLDSQSPQEPRIRMYFFLELFFRKANIFFFWKLPSDFPIYLVRVESHMHTHLQASHPKGLEYSSTKHVCLPKAVMVSHQCPENLRTHRGMSTDSGLYNQNFLLETPAIPFCIQNGIRPFLKIPEYLSTY